MRNLAEYLGAAILAAFMLVTLIGWADEAYGAPATPSQAQCAQPVRATPQIAPFDHPADNEGAATDALTNIHFADCGVLPPPDGEAQRQPSIIVDIA